MTRARLSVEEMRRRQRERYRLKREAAGLPPRKIRTPEERREAKRLLNQRRYRPVSKVGGPAIKDSAKRIHSDTLRIAQQPVVSVDDFIRQHPERYQVLPGFQQVAPGPGQVHFAQRGRAA